MIKKIKMQIIVAAMLFITGLNNQSVIAQWATLPSLTDGIHSVFFTDDNIGHITKSRYIGGGQYEGDIAKTINGGNNWTVQKSPINILRSIYFVDADTGYCAGDNGAMFKTIDAGNTWNSINSFTPSYIENIYFKDSINGFFCTDGTQSFQTNNGGVTWSVNSTMPWGYEGISFPSSDTGYCSILEDIYITIDGGTTWSLKYSNSSVNINTLFFSDNNHGCAVGKNGGILLTKDGGTTWNSISSGTILDLESVFFVDTSRGYIVGDNTGFLQEPIILGTIDGGNTWMPLSSGGEWPLNQVFFPSVNVGYAVGWGGQVLKCTGFPTTVSHIDKFEISLYPNPFHESTTIKLNNDQCNDITFVLYNVMGGEAMRMQGITDKKLTFNRGNLPNGVYFYKLTSEDGIIGTGKLFIQ